MMIRPATNKGNRETTFYVTGDSGREYIIHHKRNLVSHRRVWTCNCPDFTERRQFNGTFCKHIVEVQVAQAAVTIQAVMSPASSNPAPTVKQALSVVVAVLNGLRAEAKPLWDILTALRGPDDGNPDLKQITTATVRGAIGIMSGGNTGAIVSNQRPFGADLDRFLLTDRLQNEHKAAYHFVSHYREALIALKSLGYIS
jgi:hypothetical protein